MRKACSIIQSITPSVLLIPFLMVTVGQVISAGLDKKILFWDMRMAKTIEYLRNLGAEVDSMSLFGLNFLVAIGSSIHEYDLRKLDKLVQSKESHLNIRIRCVSSIPYSKGIITVIRFFFVVVNHVVTVAGDSFNGKQCHCQKYQMLVYLSQLTEYLHKPHILLFKKKIQFRVYNA